jgi:hypothetical protein
MKVVKLDRRFRSFREYGHTMAVKFNYYNDLARHAEDTARELLGSQYGVAREPLYSRWRAYFGKTPKDASRMTYWISFRDESAVTMLLLKLDQNT